MKKVLITYHMTNGEEDAETCIALPMADEVAEDVDVVVAVVRGYLDPRHDLHAELAKNGAHFLQFLGVLRCQNKFHRQTSHGSFSRLFLLFSSRFSSSRCALRSSRCALIFSCHAVNFLSSLSSGHSISGTGTMTTLQLSQ